MILIGRFPLLLPNIRKAIGHFYNKILNFWRDFSIRKLMLIQEINYIQRKSTKICRVLVRVIFHNYIRNLGLVQTHIK